MCAFIASAIFADDAFAQAPREKSRRTREEASPICLWMMLVEAREFRQRCGPSISDTGQQSAERALQVFESYFREHGVPAEASASYIEHMRRDFDRYPRCDSPDQTAISGLFDQLTRPEFIDRLADELRRASGPDDGTCL
jgi:hypothetical protein